jgi:hypothetical protein
MQKLIEIYKAHKTIVLVVAGLGLGVAAYFKFRKKGTNARKKY